MSAKIRTGIIGLGLSMVLICATPKMATGRCIGADRARVLRVFELLSYYLMGGLETWEHDARNWVLGLYEPAARLGAELSMDLLRWESRGALQRLLAGEAFSAVNIAAELDQARLILGRKPFSPKLLVKWQKIFARTAGAFHVCRAVRQKSPDACKALEPLGKKPKPECESLAIRVGILYPGHCSDEAIRSVASAWGRKTDTIRILCQAIEKQEPGLCATLRTKSPQEKILCRALAGDGEAACGDSALGEKTARECNREVRIRQAVSGEIPLSAFSEEMKSSLLLWPALLAARSDTACDQLAVDAFEKQIAALEPLNPYQTTP